MANSKSKALKAKGGKKQEVKWTGRHLAQTRADTEERIFPHH